MNCPACNIDMAPLVEGIFQCPQCKKIVSNKKEEKVEEAKKVAKGDFQDGEFFHRTASINSSYEICEKGIIINKTDTRMFAVLICHNAYLKDEQYVRLSWWKKSFYQHAGMMKLYEVDVLKNLIKSLEDIDKDFDEFWTFEGKFQKNISSKEEDLIEDKNLDLIKYRIIENRTCPNCQKKMKKEKSHYECPHCGEIVILEGYNQPIFNIPSSELKLNYHSNFPINFYLPVSGITIKWLMGEWKALVVIYSKDNPNKKWLRFYWWSRDLKSVLKYGITEMMDGSKLGWKAQKGAGNSNLYDKKIIKPLIEALKKTAEELNWNINNN
ncbi:MAG: hypothetical protein KGD57_06805 [Candidatus Lokiarchaeota archaeon]|nr:hypothetical protein [Candidatus Lokiarchaeota archaeon]